MRIISGKFGGRSIKSGEGPGYRPATGKVRQSIFSMLEARGMDWDGVRVVDMFAGTGSLGIEALSRGAEFALFVEKSAKAAAIIRQNLKDLGISPAQGKVISKDLFNVLSKAPEKPFHLGFIDPPYGKGLLAPALEKAVECGWFAGGGFVLAEVEKQVDPPENLANLELETDRLYGQTRIFLWRT